MGCCAAKDRSDEIELLAATSDAVCCKAGPKGENVKIIPTETSCNFGVKGSGTLIGSCCLDCDTAMWEVKVGSNPAGVAIGVKKWQKKATGDLSTFLDSAPDTNSPSWMLSETELKEGDVVGVYWDQTDLPMLSFSVNGKMVGYAVTRIRPTTDIHAAVSVREGSSCEICFGGKEFQFAPKSSKFKQIICSTNLI
jgi:hypothetical protein